MSLPARIAMINHVNSSVEVKADRGGRVVTGIRFHHKVPGLNLGCPTTFVKFDNRMKDKWDGVVDLKKIQ